MLSIVHIPASQVAQVPGDAGRCGEEQGLRNSPRSRVKTCDTEKPPADAGRAADGLGAEQVQLGCGRLRFLLLVNKAKLQGG